MSDLARALESGRMVYVISFNFDDDLCLQISETTLIIISASYWYMMKILVISRGGRQIEVKSIEDWLNSFDRLARVL